MCDGFEDLLVPNDFCRLVAIQEHWGQATSGHKHIHVDSCWRLIFISVTVRGRRRLLNAKRHHPTGDLTSWTEHALSKGCVYIAKPTDLHAPEFQQANAKESSIAFQFSFRIVPSKFKDLTHKRYKEISEELNTRWHSFATHMVMPTHSEQPMVTTTCARVCMCVFVSVCVCVCVCV
jgi:hypothetical protein